MNVGGYINNNVARQPYLLLTLTGNGCQMFPPFGGWKFDMD